jgi:hypothetical protein
LAGGHVPGHISQPAGRGPGRPPQSLERGLGIDMLTAHDDALDAAEVAPALWATAELFQRLQRECAQRLGPELSVPILGCDAGWARCWA